MRNLKRNFVPLLAGLVIGLGSIACNNTSDIPTEKPVSPTCGPDIKTVSPSYISIEYHEGHSHLKRGTEGDIGDVFWSPTYVDRGFHANPDTRNVAYPYKTVSVMYFDRQADGSYKLSTKDSTDAFRMVSSKIKGGLWNAFIVRFYDEDDKRIDYDLKSLGMRDRVQMFWTVSDIEPLRDDIPLKGEIKPTEAFYFWNFDRATDSDRESPILKTPTGFRGVVQCHEPYIKYNVNLTLTILPPGQTKDEKAFANSISPSEEQKKNIVFKLTFPCRNITSRLKEGFTVSPTDPDYDEKDEAEYTRFYSDIAKEYNSTPKEIEKLYQEAVSLPVEGPGGSQFWL